MPKRFSNNKPNCFSSSRNDVEAVKRGKQLHCQADNVSNKEHASAVGIPILRLKKFKSNHDPDNNNNNVGFLLLMVVE